MSRRTTRKVWASVGSVGFVALVGCTTLSGAEDFRTEPVAPAVLTPSSDSGVDGAESAAADAGNATTSTFVCPRGLANCNGNTVDGCEVDTQKDEQNCGNCGAVCSLPDSTCLGGKCGPPPPSCKALLAAEPGTPSGNYILDPDGDGANPSFSATCDMDTGGGGWTLVFVPESYAYSTPSLDYTVRDPALLSGASEGLLTYRDDTGVPVGTTARINLPADWKKRSPFQAAAQDVNVAVTIDGVTSAKMLRYGFASFQNLCADDWDTTQYFGRICIVGSKAPYYTAFAIPGGDLCANSSEGVNAVACGPKLRFTIGIR